MSRLFIVASLITAFSSFASADAPRFAQPPPGTSVSNVDQDIRFVGVVDRDTLMPRALDRAQVRAKLAAARASNLALFRAYQNAGSFPSNTYTPGMANVWLDEDGKFCAAATIIRMSGKTALVDQIAEQNNFIKLGDVTQGAVMDWILTSGLTQGEIAAIQEPFIGVTDDPGEPSWQAPRPVDITMRTREDARLRAKYKQVDAQIVKNAARSLDAATDRLMKNPALAKSLLGS
ncbi:MAG: hypothetical protein H0V17_30465 [Deltaproteobacteria bacterium]|nr:hypothetical protein [Deltaproteobacteria bacterium]